MKHIVQLSPRGPVAILNGVIELVDMFYGSDDKVSWLLYHSIIYIFNSNVVTSVSFLLLKVCIFMESDIFFGNESGKMFNFCIFETLLSSYGEICLLCPAINIQVYFLNSMKDTNYVGA